jgi:putative GTP pyrophosphokinase
LQAFDHIRARVNVTAYGKGHEQKAAEQRVHLEKDARTKIGIQVALVAVQSVDTLRVAYPNYFSDTQRFLKELDIALHGAGSQPFAVS